MEQYGYHFNHFESCRRHLYSNGNQRQLHSHSERNSDYHRFGNGKYFYYQCRLHQHRFSDCGPCRRQRFF